MHIADPARGNLGANGIVGGGLPIAVGAALSAKRRQTGAVVVSFFGDGANNEGAFHEALNMASIWKLPVVFVCENNQYGMSTSTARSTAVKHIAERAVAYSMPGVSGGRQPLRRRGRGLVRSRRAGATAGEGPTLIESKTYRIRGHSRSDRNRYRTKEEIESWQQRDPIALFEAELRGFDLISAVEIEAVRAEVEAEIAEALEYARTSPAPALGDLTRDVYTEAA